jgi:hypothetical protein
MYKYLKDATDRDPSTVALKNCTDTSIIIRDEFNNNYRVFNNWDSFWLFADSVPIQEQCFHEVIMGEKHQRIKFDLDVKLTDLKNISLSDIETITNLEYDNEFEDIEDIGELHEPKAKMYIIIKYMLSIIIDQLYIDYFDSDNLIVTTQSFVILDSSGYTDILGTLDYYKFSYHIVLTKYLVDNFTEAKYISTGVYNKIHPKLQFVFDTGVNKSVQNFRLIDSTKPNHTRFLKSTSDYDLYNVDIATRKNSVIRPGIKLPILSKKYSKNIIEDPKLSDDYIEKAIEDVCKKAEEIGLLKSHKFRDVSGMLFMFDRIAPSMCNICHRVHDNDNTLMIALKYQPTEYKQVIVDGPGTSYEDMINHASEVMSYNVFEFCRHAPATSKNSLGTIDIESAYITGSYHDMLPPAKSGTKPDIAQNKTASAINKRVGEIKTNTCNPHLSNSTKMEKLAADYTNIYDQNTMRPYELKHTLVVKAQMKMGKTKALKDYIDRYFIPSAGIQPIITWLTFRQTFSKSIQSTFTDFISYADINGEINQNRYTRLIIQVESLFRIQMNYQPDPIDLLILDEVESIFEQFNSGLHKKFNVNFAIFKWMISTAKYVICMDANVSDRTYNTLKNLRPNHQTFFHWNTFKRAAEDKYYFCSDRNLWMSKLFELLDKNNKVVIPINSYGEAATIEEVLRGKYKDKKIKLYSSKTSASEKNKHFSDVHTYWSELDILIYTPTVSAGISYELEHFDVTFGYFTDKSCTVESCRQMLGRIRNIKAYYIYLCGQGNALPIDTKDIKKQLYDSRTNLYKKLDNNLALSFEFDKHGKIEYHESAYFNLWLENKRIENLSKNYFVRRFIDQVVDSGAEIIELVNNVVDSELRSIASNHNNTKRKLLDKTCDFIATRPNIEYDEFKDIKDRIDKQQEVTEDEYGKYYKHKLQQTYNWFDRPMDKQFVAEYNRHIIALIYKNLKAITSKSTILESLEAIKTQEKENHQVLLYTESNVSMSDGPERSVNTHTNDSFESKDLHYNYVFQKHYLTIWMANMLGFKDFIYDSDTSLSDGRSGDTQMVTAEEMEININKYETEFISKLDMIAYEFKSRKIDPTSINNSVDQKLRFKRIVSIVNKYLRQMYGMEIKPVVRKAHKGKYQIKNNANGKLFKIIAYNSTSLEKIIQSTQIPYILSNIV